MTLDDRIRVVVALRFGQCDGTTLRDARRALRLKQRRLAEELGLSANTISQWENGHHPVPRTAQLAVLALLLTGVKRRPRTR